MLNLVKKDIKPIRTTVDKTSIKGVFKNSFDTNFTKFKVSGKYKSLYFWYKINTGRKIYYRFGFDKLDYHTNGIMRLSYLDIDEDLIPVDLIKTIKDYKVFRGTKENNCIIIPCFKDFVDLGLYEPTTKGWVQYVFDVPEQEVVDPYHAEKMILGRTVVSSSGFANHIGNHDSEEKRQAVFSKSKKQFIVDGSDDWFAPAYLKVFYIMDYFNAKKISNYHTGISGLSHSGAVYSGEMDIELFKKVLYTIFKLCYFSSDNYLGKMEKSREYYSLKLSTPDKKYSFYLSLDKGCIEK